MGMQQQLDLRLLYTEARLDSLFNTLDELHSAVSDDKLDHVTTLTKAELAEWLHDFMYVAKETLEEIERSRSDDVELTLIK